MGKEWQTTKIIGTCCFKTCKPFTDLGSVVLKKIGIYRTLHTYEWLPLGQRSPKSIYLEEVDYLLF